MPSQVTEIRYLHKQIKGSWLNVLFPGLSVSFSVKMPYLWVKYLTLGCMRRKGMWTFSGENYKLKYVSDEGGENVDETISNQSYNVSNPDDMDGLSALLCTVDVVIDQTFAPEPAEYTLLTFLYNFNVSDDANFDFLINQSLWRYDKRVQNSSVLVGIRRSY
ncbi:hypothetical protein KFK09_014167 [Dendrobium nobile]|uniref:Uncharacterized protein n=1 Tax=Dendrobium nobile TaxID=94219 RepID=A0A8T3B951_DENNO|nr:hypothetical protein KFK09_014167 [Dendrobium nobile]